MATQVRKLRYTPPLRPLPTPRFTEWLAVGPLAESVSSFRVAIEKSHSHGNASLRRQSFLRVDRRNGTRGASGELGFRGRQWSRWLFQPAKPLVSALGKRKGATPDDDRLTVLERSARDIGERWARGWREELRSDDRPAAGGWPGTVAQARGRAREHLCAELARLRLAGPSPEELERAARLTYARARAVWLTFAQREEG